MHYTHTSSFVTVFNAAFLHICIQSKHVSCSHFTHTSCKIRVYSCTCTFIGWQYHQCHENLLAAPTTLSTPSRLALRLQSTFTLYWLLLAISIAHRNHWRNCFSLRHRFATLKQQQSVWGNEQQLHLIDIFMSKFFLLDYVLHETTKTTSVAVKCIFNTVDTKCRSEVKCWQNEISS